MGGIASDRAYAEGLDASDKLSGFRERFVLDDADLVYLNGNSLGALPAATRCRLRSVIDDEWGRGLATSWDEWADLPRRAGEAVAALIGAAPGQTLVTDNTTVNLYKLASAAIDARPGRLTIVTDHDNFPSDRYVLAGLAAQRGMELRMIEVDIDEGVRPQQVREAVDSGTALVSLSHVAYRSGAFADMAEITSIAQAAGALVLWDLSHATGSVPVDLDGCGADLAVGCTYKYLCAGPGAPAFLYVSSRLADELRQPVWGWWSQRDQFAMGPGYEAASGMARFMTGTPDILGLAAVESGAGLVAEAGIDEIRAKSVQLGEYLIALADARLAPLGCTLASPRDPGRRGSHVTFAHPAAQSLVAELARRGVIADFRTPQRFRFGLAPLTTRFTDVWTAVEATAWLLSREGLGRASREGSGAG